MADNDLESDEVDSSDDIGKDMEEQSIVAKLKDAKSTWLAQDLGGLSQGQGIGESVGTDDKWGLNKVPSVKPPGPDSDLLTDKPGKGSAARRRTVSPEVLNRRSFYLKVMMRQVSGENIVQSLCLQKTVFKICPIPGLWVT